MANAPLRDETARFIILIYRIGEQNIFAEWARHDFIDLPDGSIFLIALGKTG